MTPLPAPWGEPGLVAWRLDAAHRAAAWDGGEGAFRFGGRWSSKGLRAVYMSLDPATCIIELAVHKGFEPLDTVPHVLTSMRVIDAGRVHVVWPSSVPNPNWLVPGYPGAGQQRFGDGLLAGHGFLLVPSVVSRHSWNLVFVAATAAGAYEATAQERFALDARLHPAG